jgi:hypothetical protein
MNEARPSPGKGTVSEFIIEPPAGAVKKQRGRLPLDDGAWKNQERPPRFRGPLVSRDQGAGYRCPALPLEFGYRRIRREFN